ASKLYPALLSGRPIIAVFHRASSVVDILKKSSQLAQIVIYDDQCRAESQSDRICETLLAAANGSPVSGSISSSGLTAGFSAESLSGELGNFFERVSLTARHV